MRTPSQEQITPLSRDALKAFDDLSGPHPGFRPTHAKGILLNGTFTPAPDAAGLTRAAHLQRPSTPVVVRFSNFGGIPAIPDNNPEAIPRGMATRFMLAEHVHTDIIAHSIDGFPARTGEEFVELLRAVHASPPGSPSPSAIEQFLRSHPAALKFVMTPKRVPVSFAQENYFAVSAYRFTNSEGVSRFGRYRVYPEGGTEYLVPAEAETAEPDYLFNELRARLASGPAKLNIFVQIASASDIVDDATVNWPDDRPQIPFGTIEITSVADDNAEAQRHIIFDPIPRVDGIDPSGDPLLDVRANLYLLSGRRRRSDGKSVEAGAGL